MKKIYMTAGLFLCMALSAFCATYSLDVKSYGGAMGDGSTDDTNAIQNTIDTVKNYITANTGYTGVVTFPAGTYIVHILNNEQALTVYKNITLQGVSVSNPANVSSIIKLANNQGNFKYIIGCGGELDLSNFHMQYMGVDENGDNNTVTSQSQLDAGIRAGIRVCQGSNFGLDTCLFMNFRCVQIVLFDNNSSGGTINNTYFSNTGGPDGGFDYDHSSVYTFGNNMSVTYCTFSSKNGVGTYGARTAIEMHGDNQTCRNNWIYNYLCGINVTGCAGSSNNSWYQNNYMYGVRIGLLIWSLFMDGNTSNPALTECYITDNTIHVDVNGWLSMPVHEPCPAGIFLYDSYIAGAPNAPITGLYIRNNTISFYDDPGSNIGGVYENYFAGIYLAQTNTTPLLSNVYIQSNTINNAPGPGVMIYCNAYNWYVQGNTIVNSGSSPSTLWNPFKSMYIGGTTNQFYINSGNGYSGNIFIDTRVPHVIPYCAYLVSTVQGASQFLNNTQSIADGTTVTWVSGGTGWTHQ